MFKNITTANLEVNAQLEKIEAAASAMKKATGELNWMHRLEIKVDETGLTSVGNEPVIAARKVMSQLEQACTEFETAVEELAKIQA